MVCFDLDDVVGEVGGMVGSFTWCVLGWFGVLVGSFWIG